MSTISSVLDKIQTWQENWVLSRVQPHITPTSLNWNERIKLSCSTAVVHEPIFKLLKIILVENF